MGQEKYDPIPIQPLNPLTTQPIIPFEYSYVSVYFVRPH